MLLTPPPPPAHVRAVAAAEVALALGVPWLARRLASEVLAVRPADARALAVFASVSELPRRHVAATGAARSRSAVHVNRRVVRAYRSAVAPHLNEQEARIAIEGVLRYGHSRATPSRRHRGEPLAPGSWIVRHHQRPAVAIVVRGGCAISLRVNGRTILPDPRNERLR